MPLAAAVVAQREWRAHAIEERAAGALCLVDASCERDEIATELTWQMGRPIRYTPGEVRGFGRRAHMIALAPQALADSTPPEGRLPSLHPARASASPS